jgi:hypothetical protein
MRDHKISQFERNQIVTDEFESSSSAQQTNVSPLNEIVYIQISENHQDNNLEIFDLKTNQSTTAKRKTENK